MCYKPEIKIAAIFTISSYYIPKVINNKWNTCIIAFKTATFKSVTSNLIQQ